MRKCRYALLVLFWLFVTAQAAFAQVKVVDAYHLATGGKRVATYPIGNQLVYTYFAAQGLPANSTYKLYYYKPDGSLLWTTSGSFNNSAPPPGQVLTIGRVTVAGLSLTKGDWHTQITINGQSVKDLYFSAGLDPTVLDHAIVIGLDFLTEKMVFDVGNDPVGGTIFASNIPAGSWMRLRYQRPDGTFAADIPGYLQNSNSFSGWLGARWFVNLDQIGTWHLLFDLNGQTIVTKEFYVGPTSVLLVHGTWSDAGTWNNGMSQRLRNEGYTVEAVNFPDEIETQSNENKIEAQARAIGRRVKELQDRSGKQMTNLVCHSMGGLAARYYLQHPELWWLRDSNGNAYSGVAKLILLGTPNWGLDAMLLDPVGVLAVAVHGSNPYSVDKHRDWSPALKEMFAEWQPPSSVGTYNRSDYKLGKWPSSGGQDISPITYRSYIAADLAYPLDIFSQQAAAITDVLAEFPRANNRARNQRQPLYYEQMANSMGVMHSFASLAIDGVNARRISPFLWNLNSANTEPAGVSVYLVAGSNPVLCTIDFHGSYAIPGPWNIESQPFVANDGVVPKDSALAFDPVLNIRLFPKAARASFPTFHTDLPRNPDVINQVVSWLKE